MKTPRFWQHSGVMSTVLLPAAWLYRFGAWADRRFTRARHAPVPVISVGNATAGGAGKTPTTLALIPLLTALGHQPHILTRGYGGARLCAHRVTASDTAEQVGDEALLLARAAPTWVGRDRFAAAQVAAKDGATVLVCDDALQHHALQKSLSLLVVDGGYGFGNGRLLPAGPLREPLAAALARSNAVIVIGGAAMAPLTSAIPHFYGHLAPVGEVAALASQRVLAFAGIARPEKFFDTLRSLGAQLVATRIFADHHPYQEAELAALAAEASALKARLITTEKDAVKLPPAWRDRISVLPVALALEDAPALQAFLAAHIANT